MRLLNILTLFTAALLAVFVVLNWSVLMSPAQLYLAVAEVRAPLGLMLLVAIATVAGLALLYVLVRQAQMMRELRQSEVALRAQRELADKAEASRFNELRQHIDALQGQWQERLEAVQTGILQAQQAMEVRLSQRLDLDGRANAAQLGEIEDKLDRRLGLPAGGKAMDDD